MKLITYFFIISIFVSFASCKKRRNTEYFPSSLEKIIRMDSAITNNTPDFNKFIDSSWIIALKTPTEKLQGILSKVEIHNHLIYTFDELQSKSLNVYDRCGKYLRSFGKIGRGPDELLNISDFCIYEDKLYLVDNIMKRLQIFNLSTGDHLFTRSLSFRPHEICIKDNNHYFFKLSEYNDESDKMYQTHTIVLTDSLFNPIKFYLPHPPIDATKTSYLSINNPLITCKEALYFFSPMEDYIYQYTNEDFVPQIALDFGEKYEIPSKKRDDDEMFEKYSKSNDYAYFIESPILLEKYIAGILRVNKTKKFFLYDYQKSYTQEINLNYYHVFDPIFPIGKDDNNILISTLDVIGIEQLKSQNKYINEIRGNEDCNFLLFTKLK